MHRLGPARTAIIVVDMQPTIVCCRAPAGWKCWTRSDAVPDDAIDCSTHL